MPTTSIRSSSAKIQIQVITSITTKLETVTTGNLYEESQLTVCSQMFGTVLMTFHPHIWMEVAEAITCWTDPHTQHIRFATGSQRHEVLCRDRQRPAIKINVLALNDFRVRRGFESCPTTPP